MVRRGGVLSCHVGNLNHHGGNLDYHGGISSLPTQPPDTHPQGDPQRRGGRRPPPFVEAAEGRLPYGWVSGGWVGKEEIPPW